ncbi:hypothetical protein AMATHDRAFT_102 [Amanita thiersii Skay4041]|uniref:Uncharacterized protein n=1 Tax=Amanita thiersii Skay4041 TaxID=703135 RepID=A0A2A9NU80_9AGAR|nr:hypothetical protein AMATHDRAFT_102 [Amanita thiersii Skay4041]
MSHLPNPFQYSMQGDQLLHLDELHPQSVSILYYIVKSCYYSFKRYYYSQSPRDSISPCAPSSVPQPTNNPSGLYEDCSYNLHLQSQEDEKFPDTWFDYRMAVPVLELPKTSPFGEEPVINDPTIFAPVPVSGQPPLLFSQAINPLLPPLPHQCLHRSIQGCPQVTGPNIQGQCQSNCHEQPSGSYLFSEAPIKTFPTPSELLIELSRKKDVVTAAAATTNSAASDSNKNDLIKKPRRRFVHRGMGLVSDDPENITSHEKKRQYLECLEYYVRYLHHQLSLVGAEPVSLERVPAYRGSKLSNRSMRTLLVHMESITTRLNMRTLSEEQKFLNLKDAIYRQDVMTVQGVQNQEFILEEKCTGELRPQNF